MGMFDSNGKISYLIRIFENGHAKLYCNDDGGYTIGLNHVDGWNSIKRTIDEDDSDSNYHLYQDGILIDEKLVIHFSEVTGDIVFNIYPNYAGEIALDELISLSYFGLHSGFTLDFVDTLKVDTLNQVNSARDRYGLLQTKEEILTWFTEKTGKTVFTD